MNNSILEPMQKASSNVVYQVYKTNNYDIFKLMPNNRNVNLTHVGRLKLSFKEMYLISPIIVNSRMEIIDGQHRLHAAKELNLPIYYIIVDGYAVSVVTYDAIIGKVV